MVGIADVRSANEDNEAAMQLDLLGLHSLTYVPDLILIEWWWCGTSILKKTTLHECRVVQHGKPVLLTEVYEVLVDVYCDW